MKGRYTYETSIQWKGNIGKGTSGYKAFERSYTVSIEGKPDILGSSDPSFRGDPTKYNPEELLVASLSSCHMLWFLHLCAEAGVIVTDYVDTATGTMVDTSKGGGRFTNVALYPRVTVSEPSMIDKTNVVHKEANERCFIANSVNFKVEHHPTCVTN